MLWAGLAVLAAPTWGDGRSGIGVADFQWNPDRINLWPYRILAGDGQIRILFKNVRMMPSRHMEWEVTSNTLTMEVAELPATTGMPTGEPMADPPAHLMPRAGDGATSMPLVTAQLWRPGELPKMSGRIEIQPDDTLYLVFNSPLAGIGTCDLVIRDLRVDEDLISSATCRIWLE